MKFIIDKKIFEQFPSFVARVVVAHGIDNSKNTPGIASLLRETEKNIKDTASLENLATEPKIQCWRQAYKALGSKEYRASVEALRRLVLKGVEMRHINNLVDLYNYISLKHTLPVGGEDIDSMTGDLALTYAGSNEPVVKLLGDDDAKAPYKGEIIYKDDVSAVCRRWNWREVERTKLTEKTTNAVLVVEGIDPARKEEVEIAAKELADLIKEFCGGKIEYHLLNINRTSIDL
ncbi:hypothetical protein A2215_03785 [Candidatus Berkelbacteria bacterium RIFOXYA2_FULL_43_10]|uniref:B3/B4 tRNA-binding domain-containing protein n=1 Tax=Candidatus Berkelbacteria bacterium RIFOXYA2_FULL_43_10 TaxID=1797472 RepID=A0A1F5E4T6_9BACT|nr:MAG: hypothetical protein A2215_03785 [Candidatus Berkelbacteria bacterium RIFOXYA2_FULL_43_10]